MFSLLTMHNMCDTMSMLKFDVGGDFVYSVIKRDGKLALFDIKKISTAISQAFDACNRQYNDDIIDFLALKVTAEFEPEIKDSKIEVEKIQDSVESVLIKAGYGDVAKAYIIYRRQ